MQLRVFNLENKRRRPKHARKVIKYFLALLVVSFCVTRTQVCLAQEDVGAELDRAEDASGGQAALPTEIAPPTPVKSPAPATADMIPVTPPKDEPHVEKPNTSAINAAPDASIDSATDAESGSSDGAKEKTLKSKGSGQDLAGAAIDDTPAQKVCNCKFEASVPYRDRKPTISGFFGIEVGSYSPVNYTPDFVTTSFSNYYSQPTLPPGVNFGAKYNSAMGAVGVQLGGTFFSTTNSTDNSTLNVIPVTIGIIAELNTLFKEPYAVPYGIFGEYTGIYTEKVGSFEVKGNSPFASFYALGLMFQLDWLDPESHIDAYENFGLENTFLYVEARQYLSSGSGIPDLSTPLQIAGGLKLEF